MSRDPELVCRRWVVEGRVQGVGYRWFALNQAQALGVRGWVMNRDDGAVEVVGLAEASVAQEFERLLAKGPPGARVSRITTEQVPHEFVESKSFHVKH